VWSSLISWVSAPEIIKPQGQENTLLVRKQKEKIKFYINGNYVGNIPYESFKGNGYGCYIDKTKKVEFDNFSIRTSIAESVKNQQVSQPTVINNDVDINIPVGNIKNPDAIAVVIGNRDYTETKSVDFAINDAKTVKSYLINTLGFLEGNIIYVENATKGKFEMLFGTKENLQGKLANTIKNGISDVFVFYSGHGAPGLKDQKGYFVPVECDPNYVEISGYSSDVFYQNLAKLPAKSVTVVLDACFSGATVFKNISPIVIKADPTAISEKIAVLSSSSGAQVSSWHNDKKHGLFTYYFLKSFQDKATTDKNKDGAITLKEVFDYVNDSNNGVPYQARRLHGIEQNPTLQGTNTNKILTK
jgi:hypothetical protein